MAHIHPTGWREMAVTGGAAREIETLAYLEASLADTPYSIYHGVHWTNVEKGFSAYGEIDFIVVAPSGRILLIEQKSGFLTETPEGLVKSYHGKAKNVRTQILRTIDGLMKRFGDAPLSIDYLLYCPDYQVRDPHLAGIDPRHIIDAGSKEQLARVIREAMPVTPQSASFEKVARFLGDTLSLRPDPSAMIGCAAQMVTRLSGGLATWARRLEFAPYRLRVVGTAGSGKTQLALAEYAAAIDAGLRPLYVCFNRPLADHIERLVPAGGRVATFHMLGDAFMRAQGITPDYAAPGMWTRWRRCWPPRRCPRRGARRADCRRGPGLLQPLARHPAAHAQGGRPRHLARGPDAEPVWPRDGAAAGMGDAAFAHQLPQPAPDRRHAGLDRRRARSGGSGQPVRGRRHRSAGVPGRRTDACSRRPSTPSRCAWRPASRARTSRSPRFAGAKNRRCSASTRWATPTR